MNIIFDLIFRDEIPYSVVLNLDELEKFDKRTKKLTVKIRKRLKMGEDDLKVEYETFTHIWDAWNIEGVKPSYPMMVHGQFTLYEA